MRKHKHMTLFAFTLVLALLLAACGGSDTAEDATAVDDGNDNVMAETTAPDLANEVADQPETMTEEDMVDEEVPGAENILNIAVSDGRFNTLIAAANAAGLGDALANGGPFTVFAPTDAAFAALPEGTVEALLEDPMGDLQKILLYHLVDGAVKAETVVNLDSATTLNGQDVSINVEDGNVFLNEDVQVIITDIEASNGVIHVIDAVLLPPAPMSAETEEEAPMSNSIVDIAVADGRFETLVSAVDAAGLVETLSTDGPFTIFAPTDDAFAALPAGTVDGLLAEPESLLTDVLLYHVVASAVNAETVVTLDSATTLNGQDIAIKVEDGNVFLNDTVQVIITDIEANNGIIHVVDAVLLPPAVDTATQSIVDIAVADGRFTTLVTAVQAAGLDETLAGEGRFTVFAPTDAAFAALPEGTIEALLSDPEGDLTQILLYHVVDGALESDAIVQRNAVTTLSGGDINIAVEDGNVILNDSAQVVITDIQANNGIIHVIDAVLLPSDETITEIAVADGRFETLVAALVAADLAETLSGDGPGQNGYTVFAPTDDAFAALPEGTLDALLADPSGALTEILLYHVVAGEVNAETVVTLDSATTLNGADVHIRVQDGNVFLNDTVQVIITDIQASNGIIHVIDAVLLPPTTDSATQSDAVLAAADGGAHSGAIYHERSRRSRFQNKSCN